MKKMKSACEILQCVKNVDQGIKYRHYNLDFQIISKFNHLKCYNTKNIKTSVYIIITI